MSRLGSTVGSTGKGRSVGPIGIFVISGIRIGSKKCRSKRFVLRRFFAHEFPPDIRPPSRQPIVWQDIDFGDAFLLVSDGSLICLCFSADACSKFLLFVLRLVSALKKVISPFQRTLSPRSQMRGDALQSQRAPLHRLHNLLNRCSQFAQSYRLWIVNVIV